MHLTPWVWALALDKAGRSMAVMAMTTRSSINVKPLARAKRALAGMYFLVMANLRFRTQRYDGAYRHRKRICDTANLPCLEAIVTRSMVDDSGTPKVYRASGVVA